MAEEGLARERASERSDTAGAKRDAPTAGGEGARRAPRVRESTRSC